MERNVEYIPSVPSSEINEHVSRSEISIAATFCGIVLSISLISGTFVQQTIEQFPTYIATQISPSSVDIDVQEYHFRANRNISFCDEWLFSPQETIMEQQAEVTSKKRGVLAMIDKEVPIPFLASGFVFAVALFIVVHALVTGIAAGAFIMNPVYLIELAFGFFGLIVTDLVAIREWRKKRGWKERRKP